MCGGGKDVGRAGALGDSEDLCHWKLCDIGSMLRVAAGSGGGVFGCRLLFARSLTASITSRTKV